MVQECGQTTLPESWAMQYLYVQPFCCNHLPCWYGYKLELRFEKGGRVSQQVCQWHAACYIRDTGKVPLASFVSCLLTCLAAMDCISWAKNTEVQNRCHLRSVSVPSNEYWVPHVPQADWCAMNIRGFFSVPLLSMLLCSAHMHDICRTHPGS